MFMPKIQGKFMNVWACVQIQSGLGKLILKEEMEKEQIRERHARSLSAQRYDSKHSNCDAGTEQLQYAANTLHMFKFNMFGLWNIFIWDLKNICTCACNKTNNDQQQYACFRSHLSNQNQLIARL